MFTKTIALLAIAAVANCQYLHAPHVGAQAEHTVRGYGGLSTVSHQSKAVVSPYSSVQKTDTRLTNDLAYAHHGYAAPALAHHGYAAPAYAHHGYAAAPALAHGYAAPAYAHHGYAAPALAHHGYAAPALAHGYAGHGYAAPALAHGYAGHGYAAPLAAKAVAPAGLLGHAYSSVPAVASHTFSRTYGHGTLAYAY